MGYARARSVVVDGVTGRLVTVEADISPGLSAVFGSREQGDRVRAAILNSGYGWPDARVTLPCESSESITDLAVAVALLAADGCLPVERLDGVVLLGELSLDGRLRPVRGIVPAVSAAGTSTVIVPAGCADEAAAVPGAVVVPAVRLSEVLERLRDGTLTPHIRAALRAASQLDLSDVPGNHAARFALEVCAAGGHHLFMVGDGPGLMLAERLPGILPPLDDAAALEVEAVYSVAGQYDRAPGRTPPMSAPHHTTTLAGITGNRHRPGALSLAHRGVLHLHEAPEFNRRILDALPGPMDSGEVRLLGRERLVHYPARFQLVLSAATCPCGRDCTCTAMVRRRYLERLARPLEHVELRARFERSSPAAGPGEPSAVVAARVREARERAAVRLAGTPWRANAEVPVRLLRRYLPAVPEVIALLDVSVSAGLITATTVPQLVRVTWTLADLRGASQPTEEDAARAMELWQGARDASR
ncbi:YifB family Mg chelatase-like AAA ATPase [Nonomuraea endophytica]|uniref:YifB family Mg chelatase-like AAA ATPase n=1 Tax=Nonomuraea endophytica TaxID=714136 RepID=UPI0037C6AFB7